MSKQIHREYLDLYEAIWRQAIEDDRKFEPDRLINEAATEFSKYTGIYQETYGGFEKIDEKITFANKRISGLTKELQEIKKYYDEKIANARELEKIIKNKRKDIDIKDTEKLQINKSNLTKAKQVTSSLRQKKKERQQIINKKIKILRNIKKSLRNQYSNLQKNKDVLIKRYEDYYSNYKRIARNILKRREFLKQPLNEKLQDAINEKVIKEGMAWPTEMENTDYNQIFEEIKQQVTAKIKEEKLYKTN